MLQQQLVLCTKTKDKTPQLTSGCPATRPHRSVLPLAGRSRCRHHRATRCSRHPQMQSPGRVSQLAAQTVTAAAVLLGLLLVLRSTSALPCGGGHGGEHRRVFLGVLLPHGAALPVRVLLQPAAVRALLDRLPAGTQEPDGEPGNGGGASNAMP